MKHIKRKCQSEVLIREPEEENSKLPFNFPVDKELLKKVKIDRDTRLTLRTQSGIDVDAFPFKANGKLYFVPEPDPVLVYFDIAQRQCKTISDGIKDVLKAYDIDQEQMVFDSHKIYTHFEMSAIFIISLFTSIEAFINKMIPDEYTYEDKKSNRTELYNKDQIQRLRWSRFDGQSNCLT